MDRVTGIGGIFFKARNPRHLMDWYRTHLGIPIRDKEEMYATFEWREAQDPDQAGATVWALFPQDTRYFDPGIAPFMVNYRVANLDGLLEQLRAGGVPVEKPIEEYEYGRFGWITDPEGNRIELWEPPRTAVESDSTRGNSAPPDWLILAQRLQAIAQNGLTFAKDPFDIERYEAVRTLAAELIAGHTRSDAAFVAGLFAGQTGYATPKVDVRGVVFREEALLLVKEREDNRWTLPGGWADVNDSPREAVEREIREEAGFETRAEKLLMLLDRNKHGHPPLIHHIYKLFIRCQLLGGQATESIETSEAAFFREDEIPPLSLTRVVPSQIARLFEHYRHPEWPTDFD